MPLAKTVQSEASGNDEQRRTLWKDEDGPTGWAAKVELADATQVMAASEPTHRRRRTRPHERRVVRQRLVCL